MSEKENAADTAEETSKGEEKATPTTTSSKRSREDLKKTPHGMVLLIIRAAFSLTKQHGFKGTDLEGNDNAGQLVYTKGKEDGAFEALEVGGEEFGKVLDAAKAAQSDIDKLKYSDSVKALINAWNAIPKKERVGTGLKEGSVSDIDLGSL